MRLLLNHKQSVLSKQSLNPRNHFLRLTMLIMFVTVNYTRLLVRFMCVVNGTHKLFLTKYAYKDGKNICIHNNLSDLHPSLYKQWNYSLN